MVGRKKVRHSSNDSDSSAKPGRKARSKFETIDKEEPEALPLHADVVQESSLPVSLDITPCVGESASTELPPPSVSHLPDVFSPSVAVVEPVNEIAEPPQTTREECLPLAAVAPLEADREKETIHRTLREPNPPDEIVIVTKPGAIVPSLPMDLMELLAA